MLDAKGQQIESARVHVTELRVYLYTFAAMQSAGAISKAARR